MLLQKRAYTGWLIYFDVGISPQKIALIINFLFLLFSRKFLEVVQFFKLYLNNLSFSNTLFNSIIQQIRHSKVWCDLTFFFF